MRHLKWVITLPWIAINVLSICGPALADSGHLVSLSLVTSQNTGISQAGSFGSGNNPQPRKTGRSPRRVSGGKRTGDICTADSGDALDQKLVALVPETEEIRGTAALPIFWFYVPYRSTATLTAQFTLLDEANNLMTPPAVIALPGQRGIIAVKSPVPLNVNQLYHWFLTVECDPKRPARNPVVDGWVQRVEESASRGGATRELWYDALAIAGQQRDRNPNASRQWRALLTAVQLKALADQPILDCCQAKP